MFVLLGNWVTAFLTGYVAGVVATLSAALTPIALLWLTVYIANYGYSVIRGEAQDPFATFAWKMVKMSFIIAIALTPAHFMALAFETADGIQDSMATIFIQGVEYGEAAPTTVFGALNDANDRADDLLKLMWMDAGIVRLDLVVASIFFALGTAIFLILGAFVALLSKVILAFVMAIGPIAILALMFKSTSKFFDAWLSAALSAVVLAWFVYFALGLSFFVVEELINRLVASGAFTPGGLVNAVTSAVTYMIFMLLLAILLYQAPQLASALTGGAAIQTGAQMLAAGAAAQRLFGGGGKGAGSQAAGGSGGGSMRRGAGPAYQTGRAAGATASAGMSAARSATATGVAAYQRVARRGNRT